MCIYYKNRPDLTYGTGEHIIPAGLGGIKKLTHNVVSKEFNEYISTYEAWLLKDSLISSVRQIIGPGSRGRTAPKYESKSKVHLLEKYPSKDELSVGYIQKGEPRIIPYLSFDSESLAFNYSIEHTPDLDIDAAIEDFALALDNIKHLRIKTIIDNRLSSSTIFFGYKKDVDSQFDAFFFKNDQNIRKADGLPFTAFTHSLRNNRQGRRSTESQVSSNQTADWKPEYFRVVAKICFNVLAEIKGEEYVLQEYFDDIRNWIVAGGDNYYADFITTNIEFSQGMNVKWPEWSHVVLLMPHGNSLFAICSLYKKINFKVKLTSNLPARFPIDGYICDWKSRKEYRFNKYVLQAVFGTDPDSLNMPI